MTPRLSRYFGFSPKTAVLNIMSYSLFQEEMSLTWKLETYITWLTHSHRMTPFDAPGK